MKICNKIHQIKVDFNVTPEMKRLVYIYLIEGKNCYLIDSGICGSEKIISEYMNRIGRDIKEIKGIFLTHSHPDHIGGAYKIKEISGCKIYSSKEEAEWIENIDKQFKDRPIPNFYNLVNKSIQIDEYIDDRDIINLEDNLSIEVIGTSGHSKNSLSFLLKELNILFVGDVIPVKGDIPIYISKYDSLNSLNKIKNLKDIKYYLPAWDKAYNNQEGIDKINLAINLLNEIDRAVKDIITNRNKCSFDDIYNEVCEKLHIEKFKSNPLFKKSIEANIKDI